MATTHRNKLLPRQPLHARMYEPAARRLKIKIGMLTIVKVTRGLLVTVRLSEVSITIANIPLTSI